MSTPRVSVLLPVRNGLPWLERAVASLWAQRFSDFELIVLEDGSTDGTPGWLASVSDPRLRVIPTHGRGLARALNIGLAEARGQYVARHDADDESLPERFERQVAFLDAAPDIDVLASTADYIDDMGARVDDSWVQAVRRRQDPATTPRQIQNLMPLTCCITHGSVMARASVMRSFGGYRAEMVPAEDYDLWLRMLPQRRFAKIADALYRYRIHSNQSAAQARERQIERTILAKLQYLRRTMPSLPKDSRLALTGGRGVSYYTRVSSDAGFAVVGIASNLHELQSFEWDVAAITDFSAIAAYRRSFGGDGSTHTIGNFLVRASRTRGASVM